MNWFEALILGIVQGLTEFLPVSSSGHLEIGKALLGIETSDDLLFTVIVHGATVLSTIVVFWKEIVRLFKGFFKFEWSLPKLKLPHISITGSFSLVPPSVPKFGIEWYAEGGVFDSPTLFNYGGGIGGLGEAGAEAVVPLEKNTKWLDRIAERLAGYGGDKPIILQVDGKTFAQTSIDSINQLTRQTGKLGLRLT